MHSHHMRTTCITWCAHLNTEGTPFDAAMQDRMKLSEACAKTFEGAG